jgi:hypothetical protein
VKRQWQEVLASYVATRPTLVGLVLVVDIRHGLKPLDVTLLDGLLPSSAVLVLATKSDKLARSEATARPSRSGRARRALPRAEGEHRRGAVLGDGARRPGGRGCDPCALAGCKASEKKGPAIGG